MNREEMLEALHDKLDYILAEADERTLDIDELDAVLAALDELDPLPDVPALDVEAGLKRLHEYLDKRGIE